MRADVRPIDTAPRDGSRVLLWCGPKSGWQIGRWEDDRYASKSRPFWNYTPFRISESRAVPPLGWLPLPPEPVLPPPSQGFR